MIFNIVDHGWLMQSGSYGIINNLGQPVETHEVFSYDTDTCEVLFLDGSSLFNCRLGFFKTGEEDWDNMVARWLELKLFNQGVTAEDLHVRRDFFL